MLCSLLALTESPLLIILLPSVEKFLSRYLSFCCCRLSCSPSDTFPGRELLLDLVSGTERRVAWSAEDTEAECDTDLLLADWLLGSIREGDCS